MVGKNAKDDSRLLTPTHTHTHPRYLTLSFHISVCSNTFILVIKSWFHSDDFMSYLLDKNPQLHSKLLFGILNPFLCCFITATGCLNAVQFMLSWIPASYASRYRCCYRRISLPPWLCRGYPTASIMLQGSGVSTERTPSPPPPHSLQKQQPAAASVSSDLLNLPHFNHDSAPLLSSRGSLARIPKPPAASSRRSSLSGVSRPVSQPARRGLELRKGRKEGKKKNGVFNRWFAFYIHHIKWPRRRSSSQRRAERGEPRAWKANASWYCTTHRVLLAQIELAAESIT